jgi:hypothetical protein
MGAFLVVICHPGIDDNARMGHVSEHSLVEEFVAYAPVETFHVEQANATGSREPATVLHPLARQGIAQQCPERGLARRDVMFHGADGGVSLGLRPIHEPLWFGRALDPRSCAFVALDRCIAALMACVVVAQP